MWSKNKRAPSRIEREWIEMLAEQDCVVCGAAGPSQVHEFDQGVWFAAVPLCVECHTGCHGYHGDRQRWTLRRMTQTKAIAKAVERNFKRFGART